LISNPGDPGILDAIDEQVTFNDNNAPNYNEKEKQLGHALLNITSVEVATPDRPSPGSARTVLNEYNQVKERVNGSDDPAYVLDEAVKKLEAIKGQLRKGVHDEQISSINSFIKKVNKFKKRQSYTCILQTVPDFGHLHIETTGSGGTPSWSKETQLLEGDEEKFKWKIDDDIHIAIDELQHPCNWGNQPSDRIVLQGKFALFEMQGDITFSNIDKTVTISFKPKLTLPKLN
jgi:hypothetical protein